MHRNTSGVVHVVWSVVAAAALCACGGRAESAGDTSAESGAIDSTPLDAEVYDGWAQNASEGGFDGGGADVTLGDAEGTPISSDAPAESDGVDEPMVDSAGGSPSADAGFDAAHDDRSTEASTQDATADVATLGDGQDASANDGASEDQETSTQDAVADLALADAEDAGADDALDASSICAGDGSCAPTPPGWDMVAFTTTQGAACPAGFAQGGPTDLYSGYTTNGACECGSAYVASPPACEALSGTVSVTYDVQNNAGPGTCGVNTAGLVPSGYCYNNSALIEGGNYSGYDVAFFAPDPAGPGICSAPSTQVGQLSQTWGGRMCVPDQPSSVCAGSNCIVNQQPPYRLCVWRDVFQTCPTNSIFTQPYYMNTGFTFAYCAGCSCDVSATCAGTVEFFTDTNCSQNEVDVAADGVCRAGPT
ncbi:MAG: hypothetical protein ACRENE_31990, partial [Polyangiaceae bacterium]